MIDDLSNETRTTDITVRRARIIDRVNANRIVDQLTPVLEQSGELPYVGKLLIEFAMLLTRTVTFIDDAFMLPTLPTSTDVLYETFQSFLLFTDEFIDAWWKVMLEANEPLNKAELAPPDKVEDEEKKSVFEPEAISA